MHVIVLTVVQGICGNKTCYFDWKSFNKTLKLTLPVLAVCQQHTKHWVFTA